jgi:hypothetical protein
LLARGGEHDETVRPTLGGRRDGRDEDGSEQILGDRASTVGGVLDVQEATHGFAEPVGGHLVDRSGERGVQSAQSSQGVLETRVVEPVCGNRYRVAVGSSGGDQGILERAGRF